MKLKREFRDATDDVASVSRDFKHDVMKVKPDIFEPRVVERPTFKRELPKKDAQRPRHIPRAVPMQDVYAESPSQAGRDPSDQPPEMMFQPMEEGFISPGAMPAADLGDVPEHSSADVAALDTEAAGPMDRMPTAPRMEAESEIVVMSPGAGSMGTTSAPMGYESPYVKALMANTSSEATSMPPSRYVFDFDGWDDEEEIEVVEEAPAESATEARAPNFVIFDLSEPAEDVPGSAMEAQAPVFVAFDHSEPAEEIAEEIDAESQEPNFVAFDLSEPAPVEAPSETEPPILVAFDLSEPAAEAGAVEMEDEVKGLMEIAVPEIESDAIEAEDSFSGETADDDDDANLAPMFGSDAVEAPAPVLAVPEIMLQAQVEETIEAPAEVAAEAAEASTGISFGFLSGIQASGETGMEFVFGIHHDDEYVADSCESQTSDNAVQAATANSQRFYL